MTMTRNVVGGLFVSILFVGAVYAAVSPVLQPISFPSFRIQGLDFDEEKIVDRYSLLQGINVSAAVEFLNLNVTTKFGGIDISFSDDPDLACRVSFERSVNSSRLEASSDEFDDGQGLQVNLHGESGGMNVTLGNNYQYNGTFDLRIGGVTMNLGRNSNISRFAVSVKYLGGLMLEINDGAAFEEIDLTVDIGGLQLDIDAESLDRSGKINADINIGGFNMGVAVDTNEVGVSLDATTDIGGLTINHEGFQGQISGRSCSIQTIGYPTATHKLDAQITVGLGGGTLQTSLTSGFPGYHV